MGPNFQSASRTWLAVPRAPPGPRPSRAVGPEGPRPRPGQPPGRPRLWHTTVVTSTMFRSSDKGFDGDVSIFDEDHEIRSVAAIGQKSSEPRGWRLPIRAECEIALRPPGAVGPAARRFA